MSKNQKDLRQRIQQLERGNDKVKALTTDQRRLQNNHRKRVRELVKAKLHMHAQAAEVEPIKGDNVRMFAAMKVLRSSGGAPLATHSANCEMLVKLLEQAKVIGKYYNSLFNIDAAPLPPFKAAPLCTPVSAIEVAKVASRLKNGRSFGADGELLKHCSSQPVDPMANTIAKIRYAAREK